MLAKFVIRLVPALLAAGAVYADNARMEARLSQYERSHWDINDGLNQNTVRALAQLPDGHLVLGTYDGLMLFDGQRFLPFPDDRPAALARNTTELVEDAAGRLWVGGRDIGLHRLSPQTAPYSEAVRDRYTTTEVHADGLLSSDHITSLSAQGAGVWVGTPQALLHFDGAAWQTRAPPGRDQIPVSALWSDDQHTLIANDAGEAWVLSGDQWRALEWTPRGDDAAIWAVGGDRDHFYLGTGGGVAVFDRDGSFKHWIGVEEGLTETRVSALSAAGSQLWIGTYGGGLYRWSAQQGMDRLSIETGLKSDYVQSLYLDDSGVTWMGTSAGLNRLRRPAVTTIGRNQGLSSDPVRSVIVDEQRALWVGVDGSQGAAGLHRIDENGAITLFGDASGLAGNAVRALAFAPDPMGRNTLWVASYGEGLSYRTTEGGFVEPEWVEQLPSLRLRSLLFDRQQRFWMLSDDQGIFRREPDGQIINLQRDRGLPGNRFNHIIETDDGFWLGSFGDGVVRWHHDGHIEHWRDSNSALPSSTLMTLFQDRDGVVWAGTDSGLAYFDGQFWQRPPSGNAPWDKAILSLAHDRFDHLWVCLNQGIVRVRREALMSGSDVTPAYRHYTHRDGLRSAQCNGGTQPASASIDGEELWFSMAEGLAGVRAQPELAFDPVPAPVVESVLVGERDRLNDLGNRLELPAEAQRVTLSFSAPTPLTPEKLLYRYRLDEFDRDWIDAEGTLRAQYTGLSPGWHRFELQARRPGQPWQQASTSSLTFYRKPQWHETATFRLTMLVLVGLALLAVYRLRLRQLRQRARTLERHVAERTQALSDTVEELTDTRSQLVDAQRMASMARMLAGISHELNTPLGNGLVVSSRLSQVCEELRTQLNGQQPSRQQINRGLNDMENGLTLIHSSLDKAAGLLKRLREANALAREEERDSFNVAELLTELPQVVSDRDRSRHCRLSVDCPPELRITSYPRILRDVVLELVDNSAEHGFAGQSGSITIKVSDCNDGRIELQYCDDGSGIEAAYRDVIFEPMSTTLTKNDHSGLGMHRVYNQITGVLGGEISLCPSDAGVCFCIRLPSLAPSTSSRPM